MKKILICFLLIISVVTGFSQQQTIEATDNLNQGRVKMNSNFTELYVDVAAIESAISNINNTSDANKPVSTATQTALDLKANKAYAFNAQVNDYTLVLADADGKIVDMNKATAVSVTVPPGVFSEGHTTTIKRTGAGAISFVQGAGVTINATSGSLTGPEVGGYVTLIRTATTNVFDLLNGNNPTWTAFVPTFGGFSTPPTVTASRYILNGKMCTYYMTCTGGVSNATTYTQTIPFAGATFSGQIGWGRGFSSAAFLTTPCLLVVNPGSNVMDLFSSPASGAWLNNGNPKSVLFSITYEIQ